MKTLFLGDTHGDPLWKTIVEKEQPDRVVFIGDYFDSFIHLGVEQLHNFNEIIEYKKSGQSEVIMLIGNHDFHYMPGFIGRGYSGYQPAMAYQFRDALSKNMEHLQMAYTMDDLLCTHAGVSYKWLTDTFGDEADESSYGWSLDNIPGMVDMINEQFKYKPNSFEFYGFDPYGDDIYQTPIWIRPKSLFRVNHDTLRKKVIQIVGHTQVKTIDIKGKSTGNRYYLIDCINTGQEYLIYEDGEFTVGRIS